jgi:hypothetical protein
MVRDSRDQMVALLQEIAANTQEDTGPDLTQETTIEGSHSGDRVGHLQPTQYILRESDNLDNSNTDGSVTVQPGEEEALVQIDLGSPFSVLALGAQDAADMTYRLEVDGDTVGSPTNSPLGVVTDPFSFVQSLGGAIPGEQRAVYYGKLDGSAGSSVDLAARIHGEVLR